MHAFETVLLLLALLAGLSVLAQRSRLPPALLQLLAGLALGFVPGLPAVKLEPDIVFLLFLPPLLYNASFTLAWPDFRRYRRPILLLAVGLVVFTTLAVAGVAHYFLPGFGWPLAFVLGAIVSPPDAVAATSVTKSLGLPRRITAVLEGESLVNDATALIAYRYAVAAVVSGGFAFWQAGGQFFVVAGGGTAIGLVAGYLTSGLQRRVREPTTATVVSLLLPFLVYLLAEHLGVSGVLAVVAMGLLMSWRAPEVYSGPTRLQNDTFWRVVGFLLDGFVFILIGLQLPAILAGLPAAELPALIGYGVLISAVAIAVRVIWIFPVAALSVAFRPPPGGVAPVSWRELLVTSWAGMRGVVSLATALALPLTLANGTAFPLRSELLLLTFCVILLTLLVQGLTLPWLINRLHVREPAAQLAQTEQTLRLDLATHALSFLDNTLAANTAPDVLAPLRARLEQQIAQLQRNAAGTPAAAEPPHQLRLQAELALVQQQRARLLDQYRADAAGVETIRELQRELDVAEIALQARLHRDQLSSAS